MGRGRAKKRYSHSKLSIRKRLFITMFSVSIIPVLLFTYFAVNNLYGSLYDQIMQSGKTSIDHIHDRLEFMVKGYSDRFYELEVSKVFKDDILSWCGASGLDHYEQRRIISTLNGWMSVDWRINSIDIYNLRNGEVLQAKRTGAKLLKDQSGYDVWQDRAEDLQTNTVFKRKNDEVLVMHQMNRFETGDALVVIVMHVRYSAYESLLKDMIADERESILLYNDEDAIIASINQDPELLGNSVRVDELKARKVESKPYQINGKYIFAKSVRKNKLYIVRVVPEDIILAATKETIQMGVLIGILSLIVALIISGIFSRIISRPIVELANTMKTLSVNQFSVDTDITRRDEIGLLQHSFHGMIARNQELINREYRSKLEKHQAQINALQAQINPHFLYNTLQVIGGMSLDDRSDEIYGMTVALSDIMRYALSFSNEIVKLSKELRYVESYLHIQKERFQNDIEVNIDIPKDLMDHYIPKLILQPIIENAFEHGLKNKMGVWRLHIAAKMLEEGVMVIKVVDNGEGISNERLADIRESLRNLNSIFNSKDHIGLKNVHARLKLLYGEAYGIIINSKLGEGTHVDIIVKTILEPQDDI